MTYHPAMPVLWSRVDNIGFKSHLQQLQSNGIYVRRTDGFVVWRASPIDHGIVAIGEYQDEVYVFHIGDKVLTERIERYWNEYIDRYHTNCSSFAHYLTTGEFTDCSTCQNELVLEQGMRPFEMASRVDVGDMVCIFYGKERVLGSRKFDYSHRYRRSKKIWHDKGGFDGTVAAKLKPRSFTADEIKEGYRSGLAVDYHFMVCVGQRQGEPVWLSQGGFFNRGDGAPDFVLTVGNRDPYLKNVPYFAFIKKRR